MTVSEFLTEAEFLRMQQLNHWWYTINTPRLQNSYSIIPDCCPKSEKLFIETPKNNVAFFQCDTTEQPTNLEASTRCHIFCIVVQMPELEDVCYLLGNRRKFQKVSPLGLKKYLMPKNNQLFAACAIDANTVLMTGGEMQERMTVRFNCEQEKFE